MQRTLHPDSKGRITLGALAKGVSSFEVIQGKNGQIILEPRVEIPAREAWLYKNKEALKMVLQGIEDVKAGRVYKRNDDFSEFLNEELD